MSRAAKQLEAAFHAAIKERRAASTFEVSEPLLAQLQQARTAYIELLRAAEPEAKCDLVGRLWNLHYVLCDPLQKAAKEAARVGNPLTRAQTNTVAVACVPLLVDKRLVSCSAGSSPILNVYAVPGPRVNVNGIVFLLWSEEYAMALS